MEDISVFVIGGAGMLGHKIFQKLRTSLPTTSCCVRCSAEKARQLAPHLLDGDRVISDIDVTDWASLEHTITRVRPAIVVNCVGIIKQRSQAHSAVPAIEINSLLPHRLAALCAGWNGRLIHFSTDCVFSGRRGDYTESDPLDAEDVYGRTKALGEVTDASNALTLRTSMIGRELSHFHSLLEWFLSRRGDSVRGYTEAIYSGVTTNYLANLVLKVILEYPDLHGLYHLVAEPISKYDLLGRLRDAYGLNVEIIQDREFRCDRSMRGEKFQKATGITAPSWDELVYELVSDDTPYGAWRASAQQSRERRGVQVEAV